MFAFQIVNIPIIKPEWFQTETNSGLINLGLGISSLISNKENIQLREMS